jgi:hypothetical protein
MELKARRVDDDAVADADEGGALIASSTSLAEAGVVPGGLLEVVQTALDKAAAAGNAGSL